LLCYLLVATGNTSILYNKDVLLCVSENLEIYRKLHFRRTNSLINAYLCLLSSIKAAKQEHIL